ncbi:MAG: acetyl-CoA carboxylase carboxyltransferase subunit beta [Lachnospiraceae bacterium]|nr:acetyl-CoA carboxylase carboxyltransferase subunit beta [Lachnospiraceae bacterium]
MVSEFAEKRKTLTGYKALREKKGSFSPLGDRLHLIFDGNAFVHLYHGLHTMDPLSFPGYEEKLDTTMKKTNATDACITGIGRIGGIPAAAAQLDGNFFMGSMSSAVGERLTRLIEFADEHALPLIIFCASGGARMQEGMYSLLQMAKTSAAIKRFKDHGGLYIAVLTHPTTGGVSASFAMLGDITLAEPNALIGFAGPRVIEQTIGEKLPHGFQRSEFQEEHGYVDAIVAKEDMRDTLHLLLKLHEYREGPLPVEGGMADESI